MNVNYNIMQKNTHFDLSAPLLNVVLHVIRAVLKLGVSLTKAGYIACHSDYEGSLVSKFSHAQHTCAVHFDNGWGGAQK